MIQTIGRWAYFEEGKLTGFASGLNIRAKERKDRRVTPGSLAGATRSTEVLWVKSGRRRGGAAGR